MIIKIIDTCFIIIATFLLLVIFPFCLFIDLFIGNKDYRISIDLKWIFTTFKEEFSGIWY